MSWVEFSNKDTYCLIFPTTVNIYMKVHEIKFMKKERTEVVTRHLRLMIKTGFTGDLSLHITINNIYIYIYIFL